MDALQPAVNSHPRHSIKTQGWKHHIVLLIVLILTGSARLAVLLSSLSSPEVPGWQCYRSWPTPALQEREQWRRSIGPPHPPEASAH